MTQPAIVYRTIGDNNRINQFIDAFFALTDVCHRVKYILTKDSELSGKHLAFKNNLTSTNTWVRCINTVLDKVSLPKPYKCAMFHYLSLLTHQMMNTPEEQKGESL